MWLVLRKIRWKGPFMNITQYHDRIVIILKELEEDMPKEERIRLLLELNELLSAFFV